MKRPTVLAAILGAVLVAGCGHVSVLSYPAPPVPPTSAVSTSTTIADLAVVQLAPVAGRPTTSVGIGPGGATLAGTIVGPAGPVGGANIHVERLVGDTAGAVDVTAARDGTWSLPGVLGGRYRVRAWRAPDLAQTSPQIFFLAGTATWSMTLRLQQFDRPHLAAVMNPDPPVVDQPAALTVQLTTQTVDANGVVRAQPVRSAGIVLSTAGSWTVSSLNPTVTAADGTASWQLVCGAPGPQLLAATVNGTDAYPVDAAACVAPPTTTVPPDTTTTPATSTPAVTAPPATTATTVRR